jgi:hypothetical protein
MTVSAIALAAHPANKDAGATAIRAVEIGRSTGIIFKATKGFIPAFQGMAAPGYMPDIDTAIEWLEAYALVAA